jgi:hypothetical protein
VMDDDRSLEELAARPLDDVDATTLDRVRALYDDADPVPADLVERVRFSLALDDMFEEVAAMTRVPMDALATRSEPTQGTRTETLTFSADRLTAMVTVNRLSHGKLRLDGWIAPADSCVVRLRIQGGVDREVVADLHGRFSFADLDEGFGQLSFHRAVDGGADGLDNTVVTPLFEL